MQLLRHLMQIVVQVVLDMVRATLFSNDRRSMLDKETTIKSCISTSLKARLSRSKAPYPKSCVTRKMQQRQLEVAQVVSTSSLKVL